MRESGRECLEVWVLPGAKAKLDELAAGQHHGAAIEALIRDARPAATPAPPVPPVLHTRRRPAFAALKAGGTAGNLGTSVGTDGPQSRAANAVTR